MDRAPKRFRLTSTFYRKVRQAEYNSCSESPLQNVNSSGAQMSSSSDEANVIHHNTVSTSLSDTFNADTTNTTAESGEIEGHLQHVPSTSFDRHENDDGAEIPNSDELIFNNRDNVTSPNNINEDTASLTSDAGDTDAYRSSDSDNETDVLRIKDQLQQWALKHQIPHNALNELLVIMRDHSNANFKIVLPKDSRSLLKTPRTNNIIAIGNGKYWYNGIENCVKGALNSLKVLPSCIHLSFNIDGLPVAKSTKNEFWPILCRINGLDIAPLVVAVFFGTTKPPLELFLRPFVDELLKLVNDGLLVKTQNICVKIRCFICDTPARCFIKGTIGYNSYHGCTKCTVIGEYDRRGRHMSFPRTDMPLRTDHSFRNQLDPDHHKEKSPIEDLPMDMVKDFIIADALHLLDLGVMKRCLLGWTSGSFNFQTKWSAREIEHISRSLIEIRSTTPSEIQQGRLRELDSLHFWKAAEFKNFLLYYGPMVLKEHLSFEVYQHYLTLFCAVTICYSDVYTPYRQIAKKLFVDYIEKFAEIYGQDSVSSNIHNLCHVVDDVIRFGSLPSISAYPFESMLFKIKKLLRKGELPLEQIANRIQELSNLNYNVQERNEIYPNPKNEMYLETGEKVFTAVKIRYNYLLSKNIKDKWFLTTDNNIVELIYVTSVRGLITIFGRSLKHKFNFFERPFNSSHINIYATSRTYEVEELKEYSLQNVKCKLTSMFSNTQIVFIPVLSTLVK